MLWKERSVTYVSGTDIERMVGERGFEPPTPWSRTRCSTRLSHSPTVRHCASEENLRRAIAFDGHTDYNIAALTSLALPSSFGPFSATLRTRRIGGS